MHACNSSYTRQQNERVVHARVQFPMVIRHRSVVRTRKMLRAFLKTCQAVQLLHVCVVKFKVSGTVSNFLASNDIKVFGRTYLRICNAASDWPRTFFTPKVFLFSMKFTYKFKEICTYVVHSTYIRTYNLCEW